MMIQLVSKDITAGVVMYIVICVAVQPLCSHLAKDLPKKLGCMESCHRRPSVRHPYSPQLRMNWCDLQSWVRWSSSVGFVTEDRRLSVALAMTHNRSFDLLLSKLDVELLAIRDLHWGALWKRCHDIGPNQAVTASEDQYHSLSGCVYTSSRSILGPLADWVEVLLPGHRKLIATCLYNSHCSKEHDAIFRRTNTTPLFPGSSN